MRSGRPDSRAHRAELATTAGEAEAATLVGRVALVTGGASGIGRAIAIELTARGARVAVADLDASGAREVATGCPGAIARVCDVADPDACVRLVDEVHRALGGVDILVNNAGLQHVSPIEVFPVDRWAHLIQVMLVGPFLLTRAVLPEMYGQGWGRIINIASIHALVASPNKSAYVAAKHGLLGLTRATALEAGPHGVTANAICPAYVRTPLVERQVADLAATERLAVPDTIESVMLAPAAIRRLIEPVEVARYAAFLCSDDAASITGAAQVIDGGWTAR
jgi:3-hydroxybutyrate dehydrogenase